MKNTSESFRQSVEYDFHQNADKLDFLADYEIVALDINTPNYKRYRLKKDNVYYCLDVTEKSGEFNKNTPYWETDNYYYTIIKL